MVGLAHVPHVHDIYDAYVTYVPHVHDIYDAYVIYVPHVHDIYDAYVTYVWCFSVYITHVIHTPVIHIV